MTDLLTVYGCAWCQTKFVTQKADDWESTGLQEYLGKRYVEPASGVHSQREYDSVVSHLLGTDDSAWSPALTPLSTPRLDSAADYAFTCEAAGKIRGSALLWPGKSAATHTFATALHHAEPGCEATVKNARLAPAEWETVVCYHGTTVTATPSIVANHLTFNFGAGTDELESIQYARRLFLHIISETDSAWVSYVVYPWESK